MLENSSGYLRVLSFRSGDLSCVGKLSIRCQILRKQIILYSSLKVCESLIQRKKLNKIVQRSRTISRAYLASCFRAIFTGANQEIRDYSGKKARQYLVSQEAAVSQDTFRSKYGCAPSMRKKGWKGNKKRGGGEKKKKKETNKYNLLSA